MPPVAKCPGDLFPATSERFIKHSFGALGGVSRLGPVAASAGVTAMQLATTMRPAATPAASRGRRCCHGDATPGKRSPHRPADHDPQRDADGDSDQSQPRGSPGNGQPRSPPSAQLGVKAPT